MRKFNLLLAEAVLSSCSFIVGVKVMTEDFDEFDDDEDTDTDDDDDDYGGSEDD